MRSSCLKRRRLQPRLGRREQERAQEAGARVAAAAAAAAAARQEEEGRLRRRPRCLQRGYRRSKQAKEARHSALSRWARRWWRSGCARAVNAAAVRYLPMHDAPQTLTPGLWWDQVALHQPQRAVLPRRGVMGRCHPSNPPSAKYVSCCGVLLFSLGS